MKHFHICYLIHSSYNSYEQQQVSVKVYNVGIKRRTELETKHNIINMSLYVVKASHNYAKLKPLALHPQIIDKTLHTHIMELNS